MVPRQTLFPSGRTSSGLATDRAQRTIRAVALLDRFASPESAYRRAATGAVDQFGVTDEITLSRLLSALAAFRSDVEAGHAQTLVELVHANVFADFLEMAEELQAKSFKDPAAVITGSVLEEHLRKLGAKHGVATQDDEGRALKAERINASLAAAAVYNGVEQKSVTAWLGLRNKAAHGEYDGSGIPHSLREIGTETALRRQPPDHTAQRGPRAEARSTKRADLRISSACMTDKTRS